MDPNSNSNPIITLSPNSLYIATNQIMASTGKFHWSFYLTDNSGLRATKYHWAVLSGLGLSKEIEKGEKKAEGLVILPIHPITTYSIYDPGVVMFGYFRIGGFVPPSFHPRTSGQLGEEDMDMVFKRIFENGFDPPFTLGYSTVIENRKKGLSCRTWVMSVYEKLKDAGYIKREEGRKEIEDIIVEKSIKLEEKVARGEFEMSEVVEI